MLYEVITQVKKVLNAWSSDMSNYGRMTFGVIVFTEQNDEKIPKTPVITSYSIHYTKLYDQSQKKSFNNIYAQPSHIPF